MKSYMCKVTVNCFYDNGKSCKIQLITSMLLYSHKKITGIINSILSMRGEKHAEQICNMC